MHDDRSRLPKRTQVHNIHYKDDVRYTTQMCQWILKPLGMWHFLHGHPTYKKKLLSTILIFVCISILCFVLIPSGRYTLFREKDMNVKLKVLGPLTFCLTCAIKYYYLGAHSATIARCLAQVKEDWRLVQHADHRSMMLKNALISRRLSVLCVSLLYIGGIAFHTILPLSAITKTNDSITIRPLVYPGYDTYFDSQASPAYEIVFCLHCLCAMVQYNVITATCSLAATFATHACGQVQILMTLMHDLVNGKRSKNISVKSRLSIIAKHHVRMLRFAADVEIVLREICLMDLVTQTLFICWLEYYFMTEWTNSDAIAIFIYLILLMSFVLNILIFCYIGELLMEEYSKLSFAAYEVNWYDLRGHKALDLIMIIMISHYPPKLTAGKVSDLTLNTFSNILKTSAVYLNLLRTLTQ